MRIKPKYRLLCSILAAVVLFVGLGVVAYHGEWWFPVLEAVRIHTAPDLTPVELSEPMRAWTFEELSRSDNVTLSDLMLLVNSAYPLPADYEPALVEYNGAKMHPDMVDFYVALRDDVQAETGVRVYVASDYRTPEEQAEILASSKDGVAAALGCSEHEAGLALDIYAPYFAGENFLRSRAGRMINRICGEYGFILRYPTGKEEITGIAYEPWHLRYVGAPHAKLIMDSGLTYEEYVNSFEIGQWYQTGEWLIIRCAADTLELPEQWESCEISPDNTGYYFVTIKRLPSVNGAKAA